jgi:hypothetical protein
MTREALSGIPELAESYLPGLGGRDRWKEGSCYRGAAPLEPSDVQTEPLARVLLFIRVMEKPHTTQPGGLQKDPDEWKTGDEPMTASQRSYLETLAHDNDETVDENLTKAEASKLIDELRERSPRLSGEQKRG